MMVDFSNLVKTWNELEKEYRAKYIDKPEDHKISYLELCNYIDYLLNQGPGKKKSLEMIKNKFSLKEVKHETFYGYR